MFSGFFRDSKVPDFETIFRKASMMACETLAEYEHYPRLDDSGDDIEGVISNLTWLWDMWFTNDGNVDENDIFRYFADYANVYIDGPSKFHPCAIDVRCEFFSDEFQGWLERVPLQ